MLKRKKIQKLQRQKQLKARADRENKEQLERKKQIQKRRDWLKKYRQEHKDEFWQKYHDSLNPENNKTSTEPMKAYPCTKPRSVLNPY